MNTNEIETKFEQLWWQRRINPGIVQKQLKGRCTQAPRKQWNWVPFKANRGGPNNAKRKTLRTHRDRKSRR